MKENGKKIRQMEMGHILPLMEQFQLAFGLMTNCKGKEKSIIPMILNMLAVFLMERRMERV
jgi:hypothetical protein